MPLLINLNADMGEGFGHHRAGDDEGLLKIVNSASIACGFHAGDPVIMRRLCAAAKREGVSIGAHPGFDDLRGFGRRSIQMDVEEIECMTAYQIGALQALAAHSGMKVTHVKPHGALYAMAAEREDYAMAIGRAILTAAGRATFVALAGSEMEKAGRALGLSVAREGFCDRFYEDDGRLASRASPGAVIRDPARAAAQAVSLAIDGAVTTKSGARLERRIDTLCIHGDEPGAADVAFAVRQALKAAGAVLAPLTEMNFAVKEADGAAAED